MNRHTLPILCYGRYQITTCFHTVCIQIENVKSFRIVISKIIACIIGATSIISFQYFKHFNAPWHYVSNLCKPNSKTSCMSYHTGTIR